MTTYIERQESTCSEAGEKRKWGEENFEKWDTASKIITNLSPKDMKVQAKKGSWAPEGLSLFMLRWVLGCVAGWGKS